MKFIRILSFDITQGILKSKALFLCPVVIAAITFIDFIRRVHWMESMMIIKENMVSYGDCWFYLYGGMKEYIPSSGDPFLFPVIWVVVFATISFILLNYPMKDMQGFGQQVLVRFRGRSLWWLSKCGWSALATLLYHLILVAVSILLCLMIQLPISSRIDMDFLGAVFQVGAELTASRPTAIPILVFALPPLISIGINLVQMTLSLFIKPVFSFLAVLTLLVSSAYLLAPYMIGNYAMPMRHNWVVQNGLSCQTGLIIIAGLVILPVVIGFVRFRLYDILNKE